MARSEGRPFYKMTGSGNDFVVFDSTGRGAADFENTRAIQTLSARGTGIGADGVVFLEAVSPSNIRMRYYNSDGSEAALCGNASLCSTRLAVELGLASPSGFVLSTAAGDLKARVVDGLPEVDLEPITEVMSDASHLGQRGKERRLGYACAGVPHVIVDVPDLEAVDISGRGSELRHHPALAQGANVNFVARRPSDNAWAYRTFERGVEAETLACGTGAVAVAIILSAWGESGEKTVIWTRSGLPLTVTLRRDGEAWLPSLRGEGRIVFEGRLRELA